jgi:DNA-binding MarR family transcriptional regulator
MPRPGADLALLLLAGFRNLAEAATAELAERGHPDFRAVHDFALRAILSGADSASELGRRMAVSKQAAAKTIAVLEERGYVARSPDAGDRRRMRLEVTDRGRALLDDGEEIFDRLRARWEQQLGRPRFAAMESALREVVGDDTVRLDAPGWVAAQDDG